MRGDIVRGDIVRGDIVRGDIGTGGYCPGGFCPGGILSGGILSGGYCPGGYCPDTALFHLVNTCLWLYKSESIVVSLEKIDAKVLQLPILDTHLLNPG